MSRTQPVVLCILDGWGEAQETSHNAIRRAHTPHWDFFQQEYPSTTLDASSGAVGLPEGQMGNSEVGHMTIGAGRVIYQDLPRIDHAITTGTFATNPHLRSFMTTVKNEGSGVCHLLGLLSPGGVHSHQRHLIALLQALSYQGIRVYVHAFLDGRDTPPKSAKAYVQEFLEKTQELSNVELASVGGRFYGMDRDYRWDRIEAAYRAIALADANQFDNPLAYIEQCYQHGITDEFIAPAVAKNYPGVQEGDGFLVGNFRADRVRQLLTAFLAPEFTHFPRQFQPRLVNAAGMTHYSNALSQQMITLFPSQQVSHSMGEVVAQAGLKQLRIAETEKYAHVTFFFNGGEETLFPGEKRILVQSPQVATYDLQPEMSAHEVTDKLIEAIETNAYDLIVVNYANTDMVGHSGNLDAAIKAVECIDQCLGRLYKAILSQDGILLITADHGNAENMRDQATQEPHTAHTTNPVPFLLIGTSVKNNQLRCGGGLADIGPTALKLMNLPIPSEMTGTSLVIPEIAVNLSQS